MQVILEQETVERSVATDENDIIRMKVKTLFSEFDKRYKRDDAHQGPGK
jgi:hypothetical protein